MKQHNQIKLKVSCNPILHHANRGARIGQGGKKSCQNHLCKTAVKSAALDACFVVAAAVLSPTVVQLGRDLTLASR